MSGDLRADEVRATTFGQTLCGYRQVDVHGALERLAEGLERGTPEVPTGDPLFPRAVRGYHVTEVQRFFEQWRHRAWVADATAAWPVVTTAMVAASAPPPGSRAPGATGATGRPRPPGAPFWNRALGSAAILVAVPVLLLCDAAFARIDHVRTAQVIWALLLTVAGVGAVGWLARMGTWDLRLLAAPALIGRYGTGPEGTARSRPSTPGSREDGFGARTATERRESTVARGWMETPRPDSDVARSISGRAVTADGFWPFAVSLGALGMVLPVVLVSWAAFFPAHDRSRAGQMTGAIVLAVVVVAALLRLGFTGTSVRPDGLTRTTYFTRRVIPWNHIEGSGPGPRARAGVWLYRSGDSGRPVQVPSALHTPALRKRDATVTLLNTWCGGVAPPASEDGGRSAREVWATWGWMGNLLSVGLLAPFVFMAGGLVERRRSLWLVGASWLDVLTLFLLVVTPSTPTSRDYVAANIALLILWAVSVVWVLGLWLRAWRVRRG